VHLRTCKGKPTCEGGEMVCKDAATPKVEAACDDGDACTKDVCDAGTQTCSNPAAVDCDDGNPCAANACDPKTGCVQLPNAVTMACYTGLDGTEGKGLCTGRTRYCKDGKLGNECVGEVLPAQTEACDGQDDSCDGVTDEGCKAAGVDGSFATVSACTADSKAQDIRTPYTGNCASGYTSFNAADVKGWNNRGHISSSGWSLHIGGLYGWAHTDLHRG
jgi:hypothetical protein